MSLDELAQKLIAQIHELTVKVIDREEKLRDLLKETSKVHSDHGVDTQNMIELLHRVRDQQVSVVG